MPTKVEVHPDSLKALKQIEEMAKGKNRIVFISGNFNILHPGHLRLLRYGAEIGDFLVVGVMADAIGHAIFSESIRLESVQETSWVDYAFILREPPEQFVGLLKPSIVLKGKEHEHLYNPEQTVVEQYDGRLEFCSGDITFSSIDLLRKQIENVNLSGISLPQGFLKRHGITIPGMIKRLKEFQKLKICVIGDSIVDEYIDCQALGMSQEDPTIVVTPLNSVRFIGGSAIVAAHAKSLGATVHYYSPVGSDEAAEYLTEKLKDYGVHSELFPEEGRPTTVKQRYRASNKTLLRVNHLRQHSISEKTQERIQQRLFEAISSSNLVIFSDFNYGALPQLLVDQIQQYCIQNNIPMVADSQCSSQVGDISRFHHTTLVTPTEREARIALKDYDSGLVVLGRKLCIQSHIKNIIITLGEEGALIYSNEEKHAELHTDRLPAFNSSPRDPAGAGDSLFTVSSMVLATGGDIWEASYLGSVAAACQTSRIGNVPLKPSEIQNELQRMQGVL